MKSTEALKSDPTAGSTNNPSSSASESSPIAIQDRLVMAMFMIVGFLFGMILLVDLFAGVFR